MTIISYYMSNMHLEWPPSRMNGCTSSFKLLRYKGVGRREVKKVNWLEQLDKGQKHKMTCTRCIK